jgi:SAM-dependent methyltransferase
LLNEVLKKINEQNPSLETRGLVVDIDSTGKARQTFAEKQTSGERKGIEYVIADVTKLPFGDETLDVVISRMTMQYLDQVEQDQFLREISRVLKKEGMCILQTVTDEIDNPDFNEVWNKITELISKSTDFKRNFPSFGEYVKYMRVFEKYGLLPVLCSKIIKFPFSVSAFVERFHVDSQELSNLFEVESKKFPELFEIIDGQLCLKARLLDLRLKKIDNPKGFFQQQRIDRQEKIGTNP